MKSLDYMYIIICHFIIFSTFCTSETDERCLAEVPPGQILLDLQLAHLFVSMQMRTAKVLRKDMLLNKCSILSVILLQLFISISNLFFWSQKGQI